MTELDKIQARDIVKIANENGEVFAENIKTNQIRNFYSSINSIRQKLKEKEMHVNTQNTQKADELTKEIDTEVILLEPKVAYAAGRQRKVRIFYDFIKEVIDAYVSSKNKDLATHNFITLVESVVAFHKFHNGKDN